jgi:hypothetical protein
MAKFQHVTSSVFDQAAANSDKDDILYNGLVLAQDSK